MSVMKAATTPTNLSVLGQVFDQTTISTSPQNNQSTNHSESNMTTTPTQGRKSPKKRERTDSLKQMYESPSTLQRARQTSSEHDENHGDEEGELSDELSFESVVPTNDSKENLLASLPRPHLVTNAIKKGSHKEKSNPRRWSKQEDQSLKEAVDRSGERNWKAIAEQVPGRNHTQCLQRWTKVLKPGLIKGHWDSEEDAKLKELVSDGNRTWGQIASLIPGRTSKQCRERWCNHLDPNINKGAYTEEEDKLIIEMQSKLGNRWSIIAQQLRGRTEDAVKIRWKSLMRGTKQSSRETNETGDAMTSTSVASIAEKSLLPPKLGQTASPKKRIPPSPSTRIETPHIFNANQVIVQHGTNHSIDTPNMTASINSYMQNVNDLVAASIHNFKTQQLPNSTGISTSSQMTSQAASNPMSTMPDPTSTYTMVQHPYIQQPLYNLQMYPTNTLNINTSHSGAYDSMNSFPPHYVMNMQGHSIALTSGQGYPNMAPTTFTETGYPTISSINATNLSQPTRTSLSTPREEWGSSQSAQSPFMMEDGHTSTYDLFHQQRLRLMVAEREKGMALTSAPSPGQAMLTKELKANKERQKRQEMMQTGWKGAVEAMMSLNNETPSMDNGESLMDDSKMDLDPTEDVLMDPAVDINLPPEESVDVDVDEEPIISEEHGVV